jgi:hypothetical protein
VALNQHFPLGLAMRLAGFAAAFVVIGYGIVDLYVETTYVDLWQHLAAVRALALDPIDPAPLFVAAPYEVHLYTPYHLAWAIAMAAGQLDIWTLAAAMGLANLLLFMVGCHSLARFIIGDARMDFAVFVALLTFWGTPIWWSGVYSLGQIALQAAYPSFFALSAAMIVGAQYFEPARRHVLWQCGFAIAISLIFISHPITCAYLLLFLAIKVFLKPAFGFGDLGWAVWPPAIGIAMALAWPHFSVWGLIFAASATPSAFGDLGVFYESPLSQIGVAILGVLAIPMFRRSQPVQFLTVFLTVAAFIYVANYGLQISQILSRSLIFIVFALQLLCICVVTEFRGTKVAPWVVGGFCFVATAALFFQIGVGGFRTIGTLRDLAASSPIGTHIAEHQYKDLAALNAVPLAGQVIMVPKEWAYPVAATTGSHVVAVIFDAPTLPNGAKRRADAARFYDPETDCDERTEILETYRVRYVVALLSDTTTPLLDDCGLTPEIEQGRFALYKTGL